MIEINTLKTTLKQSLTLPQSSQQPQRSTPQPSTSSSSPFIQSLHRRHSQSVGGYGDILSGGPSGERCGGSRQDPRSDAGVYVDSARSPALGLGAAPQVKGTDQQCEVTARECTTRSRAQPQGMPVPLAVGQQIAGDVGVGNPGQRHGDHTPGDLRPMAQIPPRRRFWRVTASPPTHRRIGITVAITTLHTCSRRISVSQSVCLIHNDNNYTLNNNDTTTTPVLCHTTVQDDGGR